ncbi:hypothetical protein D3C84_613450 [compost metagenome]
MAAAVFGFPTDAGRAFPVEARILAGDHDGTADGVAPLGGGLRAAQHFYLLDVPQADIQVLLAGPGLGSAVDGGADAWAGAGNESEHTAGRAGAFHTADIDDAATVLDQVGHAVADVVDRLQFAGIDIGTAEHADRSGGVL